MWDISSSCIWVSEFCFETVDSGVRKWRSWDKHSPGFTKKEHSGLASSNQFRINAQG
jgi:hypothetical protein